MNMNHHVKKRRLWRRLLRNGLAWVLSFTLVFGLLPSDSWLAIFTSTARAAETTYDKLENLLVAADTDTSGSDEQTVQTDTTNTMTAEADNDLQQLLQQPAPPWPEPVVDKTPPKPHELDGVQVFNDGEMPDLLPRSGGGGSYLSVSGQSTEAFSPVGQGETSVTFSWNDRLSSWVNAQEGDPTNAPNGYPVSIYVHDLRTDATYQIRGTQTNHSGTNTFTWNGKDVSGQDVPDGIYEWYLKAESVSVTFRIPPEDEEDTADYVTKTAPGYAPEYNKIILDREAPALIAVHDMGEQLGIEMRDEVSGLNRLKTSGSPSEHAMDDHPLHAVAAVRSQEEQLSITIRDYAGNETVETVAAYPVLAHMGDQSFWPQASGEVAGKYVTLNLFSGNAMQEFEGFTQPSIGLDLNATLVYNHQNRRKGWLGYGWTLNFDSTLTLWPDGTVSWIATDGTRYRFEKNGSSYTTYVGGQQQYYPQLSRNEKDQYLITWEDLSYDLFTPDGRILQHHDRYGNYIDYKYEEVPEYLRMNYRLKEILTTTQNHKIVFHYNEETGRLEKIEAPGPEAGTTRSIGFGYDEQGRLNTYTDVMGYTTTFTYDELNRLHTVTDARQVTTTWQYGSENRIERISMTRSQDGVEEFIGARYQDGYAVVMNPLGQYEWHWDEQGRPALKRQVVETENGLETAETHYLYDGNNLVKITDPLGRTTQYQYDDRDRLSMMRSPAGRVMTYSYNEYNDLIRESGQPYDYRVEYIPVTSGKKLTAMVKVQYVSDPFGRTTPYQIVTAKYYDDRGLLIEKRDGEGNSTLYQYDAEGNLLRYGYDTSGDGAMDQAEYAYQYDENGNRISETLYPDSSTPKTSTYRYNNRGQRIYAEHPNGLIEEWTYNTLGQVQTHVQYDKKSAQTRRESMAYTYDEGGHQITRTSETLETTYTVDGMGNVTEERSKPVGSSEQPLVYKYKYDNRGLLIEEKNPVGETITTVYNLAGERDKVTTDPGEWTTDYEYDEYGRLKSVTSPDGGKTEYVYDLWDRRVIEKEYRSVHLHDEIPFDWEETEPQVLVSEYRYNAIGQLIEEKTPEGSWTRYTYDKNGQVQTETFGGPIPEWDGEQLKSGTDDPIYPGHEVLGTRSYTYDARGRILTETDAEGYTTEYRYEGLTTVTLTPAFDEDGELVYHETTTVYDTQGNVVKTIHPSNEEETYEYDVFGKITRHVNEEGKTKQYVYNQYEQLDYTIEQVTRDGKTQRVDYDYDAWGNKKKVREQLDGNNYAVTEYDFNALGQLEKLEEPSGLKIRYDYDDHGRMTLKKEYNDRNGDLEIREYEYVYDVSGRKIKTEWPDNSVSYMAFDTAGNRVLEIDQEGNAAIFGYNGEGYVTSFKQLGEANESDDTPKTEVKLAYNGQGNLVVQEDPLGNITVYGYDKEGRVIEETREGKRIGGEKVTRRYEYDPRGLRIRFTNERGNTTRYTYDEEGQLKTEVDPEGIWTSYEYTPAGYVKAIRRPLGRDVEREYNLRGQKIYEKDGEGYVYQFGYDVGGRKVWETDKRGDRIEYAYDDAGRLKKKITPREGTYTYTYDDAGNRLSVDKPVYGTTYYRYDERDNLVRVDEPGDEDRLITEYSYDKNGNRLSQIDPNGQLTMYRYDYADRKTKEIMYLNGVSYTFRFDYDPAGNLVYESKPGGQWIAYDYDYLHRLTYEEHSDGRWIDYEYYDDGTLKWEKTPDGTTTYTYYDNGQVATVTYPNGDEMEYKYDDNGDLDLEIVNGQPRDYDRDKRGLTTTYIDGKNYKYEYKYDPDGFIKDLLWPNQLTTHYEYKPGHLIDTKETTGPNGESLYFNEYEHNKRDFVTAVNENGRHFAYEYDSREQLVRVTLPEGDIRLYTYDGAGNRTSRAAIIGGKELDRHETIELEQLLEMVLQAIKGKEGELEAEGEGEGKGKGKGKGRDKGNKGGNGKGKGNKSSSLDQPDDARLTSEEVSAHKLASADPESMPIFAAKGGNGKGNAGDGGKSKDKGSNGGGKGNSNKGKGKSSEKGIENALKRGKGKKLGLYKKLGLIDGPNEHMTGQVENILAVIDQIVNGEVNLPPGEHEELFKLVREVGKGYTVLGTTWEYNERNELVHKTNHIRFEAYDFDHDDAGNMTTDGRSVYEWNAKGQLVKVTFPDGFGQKYEYDAKGRRTKKIQFNHQGNPQWVINYHYKGNTWQITKETDQDGNIIAEYTYDEGGQPLSITYEGETFWYVYNGHGDVVALTDQNGDIAARYEYDEWGLVTHMYNRYGERVREGIGWIGDLNTGNGTPGSRLGPTDDNDDYDFHPGNGRGKAKGWEKNKKDKESEDRTSESTSDTLTVEDTNEEDTTLSGDTTTIETTSAEETVTADVYEAGTESVEGEEEEDITTKLVKYNPYRYAHYYWDRKTQFYYLQARYYNPRIGRFLSLDEWRGDITNPLSLNRYVYAYNNPVNYVDPTGKLAWYQIDNLFNGLVNAGINSLVELIESPRAIWQLSRALFKGEITFKQIAEAMVQGAAEPVVYMINHSEEVWFGDPSDAMVETYGENMAYTLELALGSTAALKMLKGIGGSFKELIEKAAEKAKKKRQTNRRANKPKPYGEKWRQVTKGTVWDNIKATQSLHPGTNIPKSFELSVGGSKFWVHPNATKHMVEY
ncbi:MAG: hypothetical protein H0Z33_07585, partial [Bacillaceae bacterium]|nr:hypothetical protein [Bacillaceae bacterium]